MKNDILSICITVKDRSKVTWAKMDETLTLLPDSIHSIGKHFSKRDKVEIVITDWASTDWPLEDWMPKICKNPYKIINIDKEGFSKGYGVNLAAKYAMGDTLFLMDADMILNNRAVVGKGMDVVNHGGVYFPIPKYIVNKDGGFRYTCGVGNCFIDREMFFDLGGIPEYWRYGFEDSDFYKMVEQKGIKVVSGPTTALIHPYHPQSLAFKERFIDDDPKHDEEIDARADVYRGMKERDEEFTI